MATTGTSLGCVTRVDTHNPAPPGFRLVGEEHPELGEAPGMQATAPFPAPLPGAASDVHQVLHHYHGAGLHRFDDAPTQDMVAVAPEAVDLPGQLAEVPLGRAGALALEAATEPEVPALDLLPATFPEEAVVGADGRARKAHVHPNHISRRLELHVGDGEDDMQPEPAPAPDHVGAVEADGLVQNALGVRVKGERHLEPPRHGGEAHIALGGAKRIGAGVVPNRAQTASRLGCLLAAPCAAKGTPQRLTGAFPGGDHKLGRKRWESFTQGAIGGMVEANTIPLLMLPAVGAHGVEAFGVLAEGFQERLCLLRGRFQPDPNRPLHVHMVPACTKGGKAALLPSPEGRGLRAAVV